MYVFLDSMELIRATFLVGVVCAFVYKKLTGITPGGIVVPGMLTLLLIWSFPLFITSIAIAIFLFLAYKLFLGQFAISRKWSSMIFISASALVTITVVTFSENILHSAREVALLSLLVPGLIGISFKKYGVFNVLQGLLITTAITLSIAWFISVLIPFEALTKMSVALSKYKKLSISHNYVVIPISLTASAIILWKNGIKSGGYIVAPYLAVVLSSSIIQFMGVLSCVAISYGLVKLIQRTTLIIGLERFVVCIFIAFITTTCLDLLATRFFIANYRPAEIILMIAVAVLVNELTLYPAKKIISKGFAPNIMLANIARMAI